MMRPLSPEWYEKKKGRLNMVNLPYVEKVRCVIEMQKRMVPIYARRGIVIKPWPAT